jgi:hypothetical protein
MTQTVICLKWEDRYGPEYVNRMHSMVSRHTKRPLRFVCFTDDPSGLDSAVEIKPMPEFNLPERMRRHPFRRMFIFQEKLDDLSGHVLHLDLDLLVTGNIDDFFDFKPAHPFCVAENWTQIGKGIGNMSVFRYEIGRHAHIWKLFIADPMAQMDLHRNSQTFVCRNMPSIEFFPPNWCLSFKHSLLPPWPLNLFVAPTLPADAKVVAFTGKPDIDEACAGHWEAPWWKKIYKHVRPTPWIADHWR